MARGGRVIYKQTATNKRRRKSKHDSDEEDGDEEYKLEEDDDYDDDDSRYEESFDFTESDNDDDDFVEKPRKQKKGRKSRKKRGKLDPDFEFDNDFDEEEVKMSKNKKNIENSGRNQESSDSDFKLNGSEDELSFKGRGKERMTKQDVSDSDYELDDKLAEKLEENPRIGVEEMDDLPVSKNRRTGRRGKHEVSDSDFELDKLEEEEESDVDKSKRNHKSGLKSRVSDAEAEISSVSRKRGKSRRTRGVSDSDSDSNYELANENGKEDFEWLDSCVNSRACNDEMESVPEVKRRRTGKTKKKNTKSKRGKEKPRNHESEGSDYEFDEDEDNDEDFSPELDEFDEDDISVAPKKRSTRGSVKSRRSRVAESSGDDFVVKDRVTVGSKRRKSKIAKKKSGKNNIEHLDFDIDDDFVESDLPRANSRKNGGKNVKGRRKKRLGNNSESSDSDFIVSEDVDEEDEYEEGVEEDDFEFDEEQEKNNQKVNTGKPKWGRKRCRSAIGSDSFESDYLISEDDDAFIVDQQKTRTKKLNKKKAKHNQPRKRMKSTVYSDSDSDSFNFDDPISEEEFSDLGMESPKKTVLKRKTEEKGKEKQANNESGIQVCGICLSEEKKGVIQGLLDCCAHYFCFACIMEWSKVETRCPLCKGRFGTISKLGQSTQGFGSKRSSVIKVHKRDQVYQPSEEELRGMLDPYENVVCMECQLGGDDSVMLLCDTCDSSAHTYCVGLGREVPEGNWYCELCRSVNIDLPSISQTQTQTNTATANQEPVGPNLFPDISTVTNSPRPSSLGIDLNALPREFNGDDQLVTTPNSGNGASTVLGRRHIRQRIHVILSNNRQRQNDILSFEQSQRSSRQNFNPLTSLGSNFGPVSLNEGSSFRHVEGAKEEVQHMVKSRMKDLKQDRQLEYSVFKEIARKATHTILAACGTEHNRNMVPIPIEPPDNYCPHSSNDGPRHLLKDCCSSCFKQFVNDVVQRTISLILELRSRSGSRR